jgi:glycine/D-amino acid oxidase-like deaminating enzyme
MIHPGKLVLELARVAVELGVQIHEQSAVTVLQSRGNRVRLATAQGELDAARVVLATNAFPSLLKRYRWHTIPVYDYVLMTEPLSAEQLASIGWQNRQGIADMANQFHYYRITRDNRILFGGYDAVYNFGGKVDDVYDDRPASFTRLASHFFTTFPQLAGLRFSHRWGGAIDTSTRFCAFLRWRVAARWPMPPVLPAWAWGPPVLPPMCCWTSWKGWIRHAPGCAWCARYRHRFRQSR